jgi:hypothetical protein
MLVAVQNCEPIIYSGFCPSASSHVWKLNADWVIGLQQDNFDLVDETGLYSIYLLLHEKKVVTGTAHIHLFLRIPP